MGKIFKALEKAEKQTPRRPVAERGAPQITKTPAPPRTKSRLVPEQSEAIDQPQHVTGKSEPRIEESPPFVVSSQQPHTRIETVPSAVRPQEVQHIAGIDANHEARSSAEKEPVMQKPVKPSETMAPPARPYPEQVSEVTNVTQLKPEPAEASAPVRSPVLEPEIKRETVPVAETGKRVEVRYSRTKVQVNDPNRLIDNKIFSVFDDFETSDQIKILRTQVLRKLKAMGGNSILVTSANPCEGKTFTSINLGVSIAKEFDRTVLIIDADIRKPAENHTSFSTEFFSLKVEKGLTDYLMGDVDLSDIMINPGIEKLTLIPGGLPVNNSSELLNSARMEMMMAEIKSRYPSDRVVIVDGPALLPFSDAIILSRYVDGVLPVVESERTSVEDLKKMMASLKDVTILGTVLNKNRA